MFVEYFNQIGIKSLVPTFSWIRVPLLVGQRKLDSGVVYGTLGSLWSEVLPSTTNDRIPQTPNALLELASCLYFWSLNCSKMFLNGQLGLTWLLEMLLRETRDVKHSH